LQGLDANARVIYIGTFSKVLFPSLRLGYIVIPSDLVDRFLAIRRAMDLGPPRFYQEVLAAFISEGHFARHIRRMRGIYRERRTALVDSIGKELGSRIEVLGDEAGMHLAVTLPSGSNDMEIAERAARQKLWLWPLSPFYVGKVSRPGFILGFGSATVPEIPPAVRTLRHLLTASEAALSTRERDASLHGLMQQSDWQCTEQKPSIDLPGPETALLVGFQPGTTSRR
jgi:GntR family transcriptional regulator/MocR family aminotransferase